MMGMIQLGKRDHFEIRLFFAGIRVPDTSVEKFRFFIIFRIIKAVLCFFEERRWQDKTKISPKSWENMMKHSPLSFYNP